MEHISEELRRPARRVVFTCTTCGETKIATYRGSGVPLTCLECQEAAERRMEEDERARRERLRLEKSNLPPDTRQSCRFSTFKVRNQSCARALEVSRSFVEEKGRHHFLTFLGGCGLGKTHLALAIAWEWFELPSLVYYYHAVKLLDYLRAGYSMESREEMYDFDRRMAILENIPLLVLDDLGTQKASEWAREKLDSVIDTRYLNRRLTVFTTNLQLGDMEQRGEVRTASRIQEGVVVELKGEDYRNILHGGK